MFEIISADVGVHEVQGRLSLYCHLILFGDVNPRLIQVVSSFKDLCETIPTTLNKMYTVELAREIHVADLIDKKNYQEITNHTHRHCWKLG